VSRRGPSAKMSKVQLEVVRRGLEAFNARDVEAFAALVTEDFEWMPSLPGAVEGGRYAGREGIDRYFAESAETWERLAVESEELREADGRVLMLGRAVGRGVGSGADVEMPLAFVAEFREARIARVCTFLDHADARRAFGAGR
jgi:ketosteroid isomerase-like protein